MSNLKIKEKEKNVHMQWIQWKWNPINMAQKTVFKTKIFTWSSRTDQKIFFIIKPTIILLSQGQI